MPFSPHNQSTLPALFFTSGAAALGLQIVWTKMFAAGLGHEVPAMLAVVSAFLGGMALGAWTLDRRIAASPEPGRWYARLQLVIGGWAILATLLLPRLNDLALALIGAEAAPFRQAVVSFLLPFLALLPATAAMGATLPAMERWLAACGTEGKPLARVYAWNTAGAVVGTLGTAFLLAPKVGFLASAMALALLNLACGAVAWKRSAELPLGANRRSPSAEPELGAPLSRIRPLVTAFVTGLLGIGFEVLGVRVLAQALEGTLYTFAAALAVYLLGTALGAVMYQRLRGAENFLPRLAWLLCALALICLAEIWVMSRVPPLYDALRARLGNSLAACLGAEFITALAVFLPPTLLMGATFSHLIAAAKTERGGIGRAAAINTLGGALAGVVFGVLLLPALGAKWSLVALASGYLLLLPTLRGWLWMGVAVCMVLVSFLPPDLRLIRLPPGAAVRAYREGVMASVAVLETPDGHRSLRVNNRFQMGGTAAALAQRRQAHIPLLLHPAPKRALFLGPGTGITLGAASEHPGLIADGVELVPEVIELMRHFAPENRGAGLSSGSSRREEAHSERKIDRSLLTSAATNSVQVIAADARRFVRASREQYDVIVADLFHPAQDGAGFLYTREHFEAVRRRLAPSGLFCQWLPLHQLDDPTLTSITRTFLGTFPHAHAFLLHFNVDIPALALIGSLDPLRVPSDAVERRMNDPALRQALKGAGLDRTINLLGCTVSGPEFLRSLSSGERLNTDDFPFVTFAAPRRHARFEAQPHRLLLGLIDQARSHPCELLGGNPVLTNYVAARDLYLHGLDLEGDGNLTGAIDLYLVSAGRSLYFTPAYARLVNIIQVMAAADRAAARNIFERLKEAQPAQPLGGQLLGPLFKEE